MAIGHQSRPVDVAAMSSLTLTTSTSPIHHLAPEILGEIFIHCIPSSSKPVSPNDAPLLLLQVCRYWRQTARATPHLWTEVNLHTKGYLVNPSGLFQMWLDNADSLPLKVQLPEYDHNTKQTEVVIELLLDNFHRLLELKGALTPWFSKILLRRTLPLHAPYLRLLDVRGWDKLPSPLDLERLRKCMVVPQLQICHLNGLRFQLSLLSLDPTRLRALRGLWVMNVAQFESMEILASCTSLETLTIFLHTPESGSELKIPPRISIPSLRHLVIDVFPGYDPALFLEPLDVPFLEHLVLGDFLPHLVLGDAPLGRLLDALMGGNIPPLKSLHVIGHTITSEYIPWFLKFQQLETLTLQYSKADVEALVSLTFDQSRLSGLEIFPFLSTLHFTHSPELPWKAVEDLVRSRAPIGDADGRLRKVIFEACDLAEERRDRTAFTKIVEDSRGLIQIDHIPAKDPSFRYIHFQDAF